MPATMTKPDTKKKPAPSPKPKGGKKGKRK
jgi:hypothetical protein